MYESNQNGSRSATATNGTQASAGTFSLRDLAQIIRKRLWVILLVVCVVVGAAVGVSLWQTPTYEASAQVWVDQKQGDQQTNLAGSVDGLQQLTLTMIHAIDTRPVAQEAIRRLGLKMSPEELLDNLLIEQVESTNFIRLTYEGSDPEEAKQIVNTVGEVSSERISQISAAGSNLTATVYEKAIVPNSPVSPKPLRNGILALVLGLMLGIGLALLMEYLDYSWRSPEEVEQFSGVPTFATIPEFNLAKSRTKRGH